MSIERLIALISASPQHNTLYHFTDESNFGSIDKHGLLSKTKLRETGLWPPAATGGNALSWHLDTVRGIDPYVSLCMTRNHGMKFLAKQDGRLPNPRYLAIKPEVLLIDGVRVAFGVANANGVEILSLKDAVDKLDTEVLYSRTNWGDPAINQRLRAAERMEILVPDAVPRNLVTGVY